MPVPRGKITPFPSGGRRRRRFHRGRHRRHRRRARNLPFQASLLVLAGAFAGWAIFAPQAPEVAGQWWNSLAHLATTGEWIAPVSLAATAASSEGNGLLTGRASVIDADTLEIHGQRIRLDAIDAPESGQRCYVDDEAVRCGQRAALALDDWIADRPVTCTGDEHDRYGRLVARCFVDGADMGAWLVRNGHAIAYRRYGMRYVCDEKKAADAGLGIWATIFIAPETWRRMDGDARNMRPAARYDPGWPSGC